MAVIGVRIKRVGILDECSTNKNLVIKIVTALFLLAFFIRENVFVEPYGLGYQGIGVLVISAITFYIFSILPLGRIPKVIKVVIEQISKHTMAIYFMHRLVATVIYDSPISEALQMRGGTIYDCVIIFGVCLLLAVIFSKFPINWIKISFE